MTHLCFFGLNGVDAASELPLKSSVGVGWATYMPYFSDSYCEIRANLPWDFEIYHGILKANKGILKANKGILKANKGDFYRRIFALNFQHFYCENADCSH